VDPLSAELPGVLPFDEGEIVSNITAVEKLINGRLKEERLAETESGAEAHRRVRHAGGNDGVARATFSRIGKVCFVQHGV